MAQRVKDLAVAWVCLIPGPGASTCQGEKKKKGKMLCSVIRVLDMDVAPIPKAVPKILGLFPLTVCLCPLKADSPPSRRYI